MTGPTCQETEKLDQQYHTQQQQSHDQVRPKVNRYTYSGETTIRLVQHVKKLRSLINNITQQQQQSHDQVRLN